jgi:hyperosmotically inducible periplasmic protein
MFMQFRKFIFTMSMAVPAIAMSFASVAATPSQEVINARQETQIWTTYALSPYLRAQDIEVFVDSGKATLTGTVEEDVNKELAKEIALGVTGIKEVDNKIVVSADYKPKAKTSSYGDTIDDSSITAAVKSKLIWSNYTDSRNISVSTKSGKVTLTGTANTADEKKLAERLAKNTRGVSSVNNNLVVTKSSSSSKSNTAPSDTISDGWITTKVKSTFMYSSNVDGSDIDVSTNAGVVTLTGKVDSGAEHALAIELAQNVRGVKKVSALALTH